MTQTLTSSTSKTCELKPTNAPSTTCNNDKQPQKRKRKRSAKDRHEYLSKLSLTPHITLLSANLDNDDESENSIANQDKQENNLNSAQSSSNSEEKQKATSLATDDRALPFSTESSLSRISSLLTAEPSDSHRAASLAAAPRIHPLKQEAAVEEAQLDLIVQQHRSVTGPSLAALDAARPDQPAHEQRRALPTFLSERQLESDRPGRQCFSHIDSQDWRQKYAHLLQRNTEIDEQHNASNT
jgi:hypothetical protein